MLKQNGNRLHDTRLVARLLAYKADNLPGSENGSQGDDGDGEEVKRDGLAQSENAEQTGGTSLHGELEIEEAADTENKNSEGNDGCEDCAKAISQKDCGDDCSNLCLENSDSENRENGDDLESESQEKEQAGEKVEMKATRRNSSSLRRGRISNVVVADIENATKESKKLTGKGRLASTLVLKMVRKYCVGNTETAPRFDGKKVVKEIVSKRYSLPKMRGENNQAKKPCLIMVDVSPSCSAFSHECLLTALACHFAMPKMVTIIWHSNGRYAAHLGELENLAAAEFDWAFPYWEQSWGLVFNFGDDDAYEQLRAVVKAGSELIWLDSFNKKKGIEFAYKETQLLKKRWGGNVKKWNGCGSLDDFIEVLKKS